MNSTTVKMGFACCAYFLRRVLLWIAVLILSACNESLNPPPNDLVEQDLFGTWQVQYEPGHFEEIVLKEDEFRQFYHSTGDEVIEISGQAWRLEKLSQGYVRLHLKGAKYFRGGVAHSRFLPAWDPFLESSVDVQGDLVLHVLETNKGQLVLYQLFLEPDQSIPLLGTDHNMYTRVDSSTAQRDQ